MYMLISPYLLYMSAGLNLLNNAEAMGKMVGPGQLCEFKGVSVEGWPLSAIDRKCTIPHLMTSIDMLPLS